MKPTFCAKKQLFLRGVGLKYLKHPAHEKWFKFITNRYQPPKHKKYLLFLPCTWGKPYSQSYIHYLIMGTLKKLRTYEQIHQVMISNAGIIPREFESEWPFTAYDWDPKLETKKIKETYEKVTKERVYLFLREHGKHYKRIFCYFRTDSEEERAVTYSAKKLNLPLTVCLKKDTTNAFKNKQYDDWDQVLIEKKCLNDLYYSMKSFNKD